MRSLMLWVLAIASIALLIGAFFMARSGYDKHKQDQGVQAEIDALKQEADSLESKNTKLSEKIEYFKTSDFKEKLAKEKLNYKKEDEELAVIKPNTMLKEEDDAQVLGVEDGQMEDLRTNYKKWWDYFFGYK